MSYTVVFTPEAEAQLVELYGYIAAASSPEIAGRFTDGIVTYCESLSTFPNRGNRREDIRPGLRVTSIASVSPSPSMWRQTESKSSESSMVARIMNRPYQKKNETSRLCNCFLRNFAAPKKALDHPHSSR